VPRLRPRSSARLVFSCVTATSAKDVTDEALADPTLKNLRDEQWRDMDKLTARIKAKARP
jgi:hypothetical protein